MRKIIICIVLCCSLVGNLIFFLSDGITYLRLRNLQTKNNTIFPKVKTIEEFRKQIFDVNMQILESGKRPDVPKFPEGVIGRIKYNLGIDQPKFPFFEGGEPNWTMFATLEDAINRKDTVSISVLERVFNERILNTKLTEVDCSMSGGVAILLHKYTGKSQYREYADKVFLWLRGKDTDYGILYRSDNTGIQLEDGYGMYLPFLSMYSREYNDSTAYTLAIKQMEIANLYLMDSVSGLPAHGFTLWGNHSKVLMTNFGRGIAWFVSGLIDLDVNGLSPECRQAISRLDKTLCQIWEEKKCFSQYPGVGNDVVDLSAELPIIYYLSHKGLIHISNDELLNYSKMANKGLLYHSSGSMTTTYSNLMGTNILAQAFMLKLLNDRK